MQDDEVKKAEKQLAVGNASDGGLSGDEMVEGSFLQEGTLMVVVTQQAGSS